MVEQYYTGRETAEKLKVDPETIKRLAQSGKLHGVKIAGMWRFTEQDIQNFIAAQNQEVRK